MGRAYQITRRKGDDMEYSEVYSAIETKFLGPASVRGSRIKAQAMDTCKRGDRPKSVTVGYDDALNRERHHAAAAMHLLPKVCNTPSNYHLVAGATERGFVFVIVPNS